MSRNNFAPDLSTTLNAFTVPSPRADLGDRIVAATTQPMSRETPRRDRRGGWRIVRRALIGTAAAGMVSAAAVASGLLGAAGIEVPVLTAMLAPSPTKTPVVKHAANPVKQALATKPPVAATLPEASGLTDPAPLAAVGPGNGALIERRVAARKAFVANHPEVRPALREAVMRRRAFVAEHPEVREMMAKPRAERRAMIAENPELRTTLQEARQERKAFVAEHPELVTAVRDEVARRRAEPFAPPGTAPAINADPAPGESESSSAAQTDAGDRSQRLQQLRALRERRATLRALRRNR